METLLTTAVGQYEQGLPLHLSDPRKSAIAVMSEAEFKKMGGGEVQELLRTKHLLIYDCADKELVNFDEQGMRTLCLPTHEFQVQGGSIIFIVSLPIIHNFVPLYRSVD